MILAYKIRHTEDFTHELRKAKQIALYVASHQGKDIRLRHVQHFGLDGAIAKQLIKVYRNNSQCKRIKNVNIVVPGTCISLNRRKRRIVIPALGYAFEYEFPNDFQRISLIEVGCRYVYVSVVTGEERQQTATWLGVDLNTTGHVAVMASPLTGKVCKLGRSLPHLHEKYHNLLMRHEGCPKRHRSLKKRYNRTLANAAGDISNTIVAMAQSQHAGICLERLGGREKKKKNATPTRDNDSLNSWVFMHLAAMIEAKARLRGVPVAHIDPYNTSKLCCVCGHMGKRHQKAFECPVCGHIEHADVNAAFNIALRQDGMIRSHVDRGACEGRAGVPEACEGWTRLPAECAAS